MNTKGKSAPGIVEPVNDGAAVVVALGKRKPLVAVAGPACVDIAPVDPPMTIAPVLDPVLGPVVAPAIVPVHDARTGQHATFPAASRAQTWFAGQQAPLFPSAPQFEKPPGHPCRLNSRSEKSV
jgi:hypothetical protein